MNPPVPKSFIVLAVSALAACAENRDATTDSTSASATAKANSTTDSTPAATPATPAAAWTVGVSGIGPVRVGMAADELRRVAGDIAPPPTGDDCQFVRPARLPNGVSIMLARGEVARVDVDSAGVRTDGGAGVGDPENRVRELYANRIRVMPHKYVAGASYLIVTGSSPTDSAHRIVFETENGRIARYRAGRVPEVEWVERCG